MKALILAGGEGTRLRPLTYSIAKQLVPVANKPVIEYGLESIIHAGIQEIGIIVTNLQSEICRVLGNGKRWGAKLTYIPQPKPLGLAHAVKTAKDFLGDENFIMYLGDNLITSPIQPLLEEFHSTAPAALILLTPVPNPEAFGVATIQQDHIIHLEEKPRSPKSNLALVGVYLFSSIIHQMIDQLRPSKRGEYEITEAIQLLIDQKQIVSSHIIKGWWKDTGTVKSILEANCLVLEDLETQINGHIDQQTKLSGRVNIGKDAKIIRSIIRGPAIIGRNCHIEDSFIGPFTSIDQQTIIKKTEIENSIILQDCKLENIGGKLENSLLGRGVQIVQTDQMPRSYQIVVGDSSTILLP